LLFTYLYFVTKSNVNRTMTKSWDNCIRISDHDMRVHFWGQYDENRKNLLLAQSGENTIYGLSMMCSPIVTRSSIAQNRSIIRSDDRAPHIVSDEGTKYSCWNNVHRNYEWLAFPHRRATRKILECWQTNPRESRKAHGRWRQDNFLENCTIINNERSSTSY